MISFRISYFIVTKNKKKQILYGIYLSIIVLEVVNRNFFHRENHLNEIFVHKQM